MKEPKTRPNGRFTKKQAFVLWYIKEKGDSVTQKEVARKYGEKIHKGEDIPPSYNEAGSVSSTFKTLIEKGLIEKENGKFKI